jgi:phospholipid/cholesterol/gamma-HCH transport system ATP-binding protein
VKKGEIIAIIGGSGCGKTTLLRSILRLIQPTGGDISIFGKNVNTLSDKAFLSVQKRWSMMFQSSALFSSLTVLENVMYVLDEYAALSASLKKELAMMKIALSGLEPDAAFKYPAELSGGMKKRAAFARAIALDPELIFLDEPTSGLDPKSAGGLDDLLLAMRKNLGLTFVIVTHDLDTLWYVPDRVLFLGEGKVLAFEPMEQLHKNPHPAIQSYFSGHRGQGDKRAG